MPELPEVHRAERACNELLVGKKIIDVETVNICLSMLVLLFNTHFNLMECHHIHSESKEGGFVGKKVPNGKKKK